MGVLLPFFLISLFRCGLGNEIEEVKQNPGEKIRPFVTFGGDSYRSGSSRATFSKHWNKDLEVYVLPLLDIVSLENDFEISGGLGVSEGGVVVVSAAKNSSSDFAYQVLVFNLTRVLERKNETPLVGLNVVATVNASTRTSTPLDYRCVTPSIREWEDDGSLLVYLSCPYFVESEVKYSTLSSVGNNSVLTFYAAGPTAVLLDSPICQPHNCTDNFPIVRTEGYSFGDDGNSHDANTQIFLSSTYDPHSVNSITTDSFPLAQGNNHTSYARTRAILPLASRSGGVVWIGCGGLDGITPVPPNETTWEDCAMNSPNAWGGDGIREGYMLYRFAPLYEEMNDDHNLVFQAECVTLAKSGQVGFGLGSAFNGTFDEISIYSFDLHYSKVNGSGKSYPPEINWHYVVHLDPKSKGSFTTWPCPALIQRLDPRVDEPIVFLVAPYARDIGNTSLTALSVNGQVLWELSFEDSLLFAPLLVDNDQSILLTSDRKVRLINATNAEILWVYEISKTYVATEAGTPYYDNQILIVVSKNEVPLQPTTVLLVTSPLHPEASQAKNWIIFLVVVGGLLIMGISVALVFWYRARKTNYQTINY